MTAHVVTYANKSFGMFESLVNNKFNVLVKVLGMGTKWNGFLDKVRAYRDYTHTLPDEDIVVIVDGFDTQIHGTLEVAVSRFQKLNKPIVVSHSPNIIPEILTVKIFGTCNNGNVANSGLMMGRAKYMRDLLDDIAEESCQDDQRGLNTMCEKHNVYVDTDNLVFENTTPGDRTRKSDAVFIGFPGAVNFSRSGRALREYTQFFLPELIAILGITALCYRRLQMHIAIIMVFTAMYIDVSCS